MADRYSKTVLTITAACLVLSVVKNVTNSAHAQLSEPTHVIIDSWGANVATLSIPVRQE